MNIKSFFSKKKSIYQMLKSEPTIGETIEAIHKDFDEAQERILVEAKNILAGTDETLLAKGRLASELGFTSSQPVTSSYKAEKAAIEQRQLAENVSYFSQKYPFQKFINEKEIKNICEKYGLVFGPAMNYIGDIPEKNLKEIKSFKLAKEDFFTEDIEKEFRFGFNALGMPNDHYARQIERIKSIKPSFKIVASKKDFNMEGMRQVGYKLQEIPDPIVLQPVKGGYLIISKWGLEGQDEALVNEVCN